MFSHSRPLRSPDSGSFDSGGSAPKIDFTKDAYLALVNVLRNPPKDMPADLAIRVCAVNFYNNATVALKGGALAPETALACMALKNPATGENVFHETKLLPTLVEISSIVILQRVQAGRAVEHTALAALREYAASPHSLGPSVSISAYRALLAAVTRCYRRSSGGDGEESSSIDPIAEVASLGEDLQRASSLHPKEVCEFLRELGKIPVSGPLREGVDRMLSILSQPRKGEVWGVVQGEALLAAALHCMRGRGSAPEKSLGDVINRHAICTRALRGLAESSDPQFVGIAVVLVQRLLMDELDDMRESVEKLKESSFARLDYPGGHHVTIERLTSKMRKMFPEESGAGEIALSLAVSARLANKVSWGILLFDIIDMSSKILPAGMSRWLNGALHKGFRRFSSLS